MSDGITNAAFSAPTPGPDGVHLSETDTTDNTRGMNAADLVNQGKDEPVLDQGYSWIVLIATFVVHCLLTINVSSHGIYLPEFVDYFRVNKADAAVVGSLTPGIAGLAGILLGPLTKRFGTRIIVIVGGSLTGIGVSTASLSNNIMVVNVLFGLLPGIGGGCYLIGGAVAILQYFKARRTLAFGIAATGLSIGSAAGPQITRLLINSFGWRGALLIQGSMQLNAVVCGALLRPALSLGATSLQAATLVTVLAILSGIFMPLFGLIGDRLERHRALIKCLSMTICGVANIVSYFLSDYLAMAIYAGIFGAFSAGYITLENAVIGDIVPANKFQVATGFCMFAYGLTVVVTPPLAGLAVDITGSFAVPFIPLGIAQIAAGVCCCAIYVLQRKEQHTSKELRESSIEETRL